MECWDEEKNCKIVRRKERDNLRYQLIDNCDGFSEWEYTEAKLIDNHYVLFKYENHREKVFGVVDKSNPSEMEKRLKEKAEEIEKNPRGCSTI